MTTVREVSARLGADVDGYIRDVRRAGRETDKAFASMATSVRDANRELGTNDIRTRNAVDANKQLSTSVSRLNTRLGQLPKNLTASSDGVRRLGTDLADLDHRVGTATTSSQTITRDLRDIGTSAQASSRGVRDSDRSINQLTGRLYALAQASLVLGPALIPLGSLAVPALTGLVSQFGFVAASGGATILAFQGVGDAVTSLNEALANPTADNIAKAREELGKLGPDAANFASKIGLMRDEWLATRDAAAAGFFPGGTEALDNVEEMLPRAQGMFRELGDIAGDILADGTESLTTERWAPFFDYLQNQARPTLTDLAAAIGDFGFGVAEMLMALDPASQGFGQFLRDTAGDFADWADDLEGSQGLEDFLAYLRESGPQVASTTGAIAQAIGDIVMAAEPLGGPVLEAVQLIAEGLSAVAGTQAGAKIITMAAAFVALSKAMGLVAKIAGAAGFASVAGRINNAGLFGPTGARQVQQSTAAVGAFGRQAVDTQRSTMGLRTAMGAMYARMDPSRALLSANQLRELNARAAEGRSVLAGYGKQAAVGAAGAAAFALAATDTGKSLGVQNTAMLGLMGSMAGPWGAAVGVGIGALIDFRAAGDEAAAAMEALQSALAGTDPTALAMGVEQAAAASEKLSNQGSILAGLGAALGPASIGTGIGMGVDRAVEAARLEEEARLATEASLAYEQLARSMSGSAPIGPISNMERYRNVLDTLPEKMEELGVSQRDLVSMEPGEFEGMWAGYVSETESAAGKTDDLRSAMQGLSDPLMLAADSATQLSSALGAIFGPTLAAEEATDNWMASLQALDELNVGAGFSSMTVKSRENAAATRDAVAATQDLLVKRVEAGAGEREIAGLLQQSRREFIRNSIAAGVDADVIRRRANELGLTPKLIRTVFREAGIGPVEAKARGLRDTYRRLPKEVRTMVRAGELPRTERGIDRLVRKYNLTPKQKTTLVRLRDLASNNLNQVLRALGVVDRRRANPRVDVERGAFDGKIRGIERMLGVVDGKRSNPKVDSDTDPATRKLNQVRGDLDRVGGMRPNPSVSVRDSASGPLRSIQGLLNSIDGRHTSSTHTHTNTTVNRTINRKGDRGMLRVPDTAGAGGLVDVFADGGLTRPWDIRDARDVANGHSPELARSGGTRMWREPETGGEAYIPLRNDGRRPRARAILAETAELLGGSVSWNAQGGIYRPSSMDGARAMGGGGGAAFPSTLRLVGRMRMEDGGWVDMDAVAQVAAEGVVARAAGEAGRRAYAASTTWTHDDEEG